MSSRPATKGRHGLVYDCTVGEQVKTSLRAEGVLYGTLLCFIHCTYKKKEKWRKGLKGKLTQANAWAQAWPAWEAQNPTPAPSIYGDTECTVIESIVYKDLWQFLLGSRQPKFSVSLASH